MYRQAFVMRNDQNFLYRLDEGDDVQITEEKSAEQVTAEELKAKKAAAEAVDDGVVCLE